MRRSRTLAALALAGAAALGTLAVAPRADAAATVTCDTGVVYLADGTFNITNPVSDIACVTTNHYPSGAARFVGVQLADGWTHRVKDSGGSTTGSKIVVEIVNPTTKVKYTYMSRLGRVVISGG